MKFVLADGQMQEEEWFRKVLTPKDNFGVIDKINEWSESVVNKEIELIFKPITNYMVETIDNFINVTYMYLPEIAAVLTIIFGVLIMITGNFPKWFTRYGLLMTGVIIWRVYGS